MTVRECYEKMGANYDGVLSRLGNEMLIRKFVIKFLKDPSFQDLTAAIEKSDAESAFRAAHTLKGICLNLGFDNLYKPSEALTEKLRGGELNGYETLCRIRITRKGMSKCGIIDIPFLSNGKQSVPVSYTGWFRRRYSAEYFFSICGAEQ